MLLLLILGLSATQGSQLSPTTVPNVVAAAKACVEAVTENDVELSRLQSSGWVEALDKTGKPVTAGGHLFQRPGVSAEIAAVGPVCSLIAPVASFDDVKATLSGVDDAVHPDRIEEVEQGILLHKGPKNILFFVGSPTVETPAAVRIDVTYAESHK